jgi:DNA-binding MarR family transcriptional regulator
VRRSKLAFNQACLMRYLLEFPGSTQKAMREFFDLSPEVTSALLKTLERKHFTRAGKSLRSLGWQRNYRLTLLGTQITLSLFPNVAS